MIIVPMNLLSIPLVFAMWTIDSLLFLTPIRLALRKFGVFSSTEAYRGLRLLTEPVHRLAESSLHRWRRKPAAPWAPWLLVVAALYLGRTVLLGVMAVAFAESP